MKNALFKEMPNLFDVYEFLSNTSTLPYDFCTGPRVVGHLLKCLYFIKAQRKKKNKTKKKKKKLGTWTLQCYEDGKK